MRIQPADKSVNRCRLPFSGHDEALAAVREQVLRKCIDPPWIDARHAGRDTASGGGQRQLCSERLEERSDLAAWETEPVIGHRTRQGEDALDGVQPIHGATGGTRAPASREAPRVTDHLRVGQQRIGVEGEDDRRLIEPEHEVDVAPRGGLQAREPVLVAHCLVGRPSHPGIRAAEVGGQACQGWRRERFGEDRKPRTVIRSMRLGQRPPCLHEIAPGLPRTLQRDRLRSVRIVKAKHRRLDARARRAEG